jgi:hypothetical protein
MSDIYNIPHDDGKTYRLKKFVEYQHEVPSIHYRFLGEYIKRNKISKDETINLCWYMAITYNEITCILLLRLFSGMDEDEIWEKYKPFLNFGSARKYAKNNNQFPDMIKSWKKQTLGNPLEYIKSLEDEQNPEITYKNIQAALRNIPNCGRFSSDLFLETITYLQDYVEIHIKEPFVLDWKNCANLTSGIYNIFYEDERANEFDKTHKLTSIDTSYLSKKLRIIQQEIQKTYPEQNSEIAMFIGKICSFRNLFKNARYGGFHHDRQLGVIKQYELDFPQYSDIWQDCYKLRFDIFPHRFLGELNGWDGIRKERKKIWLTTGFTGVEEYKS